MSQYTILYKNKWFFGSETRYFHFWNDRIWSEAVMVWRSPIEMIFFTFIFWSTKKSKNKMKRSDTFSIFELYSYDAVNFLALIRHGCSHWFSSYKAKKSLFKYEANRKNLNNFL